MYILAFDSTSPIATVALTENQVLKGLYTVHIQNTHSETLLPMAEQLLASLSLSIEDVDLLACSVGPGSFTGVRIGVATVKGLAFGTEKVCVGVSTLEALAWNLLGMTGIICPVMNARRMQVYTALFRSDGKGKIQRLCEDKAISLEELKEILSSFGEENVYLVGDGYVLAKDFLDLPGIQTTPGLLQDQNAYSVAQLAFSQYQSSPDKERYQHFTLTPVYLRPSQAERECVAVQQDQN